MDTQTLNSALLEHSKELKDFLDYPIFFDGLLTFSASPAVDELCQELLQTLEFGRKRTDLRVAVLKAILANLHHAYDLKAPVAVSRDKNAYTNQGRYLADYCTYAITISVVNSLIDGGWVHYKSGYFFDEERKARCSRIWPTDRLIELFDKYLNNNAQHTDGLLIYFPYRENVVLKDKEKRLIDYLDYRALDHFPQGRRA